MDLIELEEYPIQNGYIIEIYLNNPRTRNSMTWEMGEMFQKKVLEIMQKPKLPRVVILSGRNDVFCAGGDLNLLKSFSERSYEENRKSMKTFYSFFLSVRRLPVPVICAASGHAIGAGLSFAFACDLRVFAHEGKYAFNFVKLGIHPGMGASYTAQELLGKSRANQLLFYGYQMDGKIAKEWGVCMESFPKSEVLEKSRGIAMELAKFSPLALQELKKNSYSEVELDKALEREAESQARNFLSQDFKETIASIIEKREPVFRGL